MDLPLGALNEGFDDRLVLETRGDLARWGGCLVYLLMVPIGLLGGGVVTVLLSVGLEMCFHARGLALSMLQCVFFPTFAVMLYYLFQEFRSRDFQEIVLQADRLEVMAGGGPRGWHLGEMLDAKAWPYGLCLHPPSGRRWLIHGLPQEKRLAVLERVLSAMAAARRATLQSGQEVRLLQAPKPVFDRLSRGLLLAFLAFLLGGQVHLMLGLMLGGLLSFRWCGQTLKLLRGGGLVLTRTGLRRPWESVDQEVPWSELNCCYANAFFQDTLRVSTGRGEFVWLSDRSPVVWALVIQALQEKESR